MKILEAKAKTIVTLELTESDFRKMDRMIEALYIVLNEGDFEGALDTGNLMIEDQEAAEEAIDWLRELAETDRMGT